MRYAPIDDAISLEVTGKDAARYLNSRLTNNISGLKAGEACEAAAISAQGRTQGYFIVIRLEDSKFLLLCDGGDQSKVLAAVKQFVVADRVTIWDDFKGWRLSHFYDPPPAGLPAQLDVSLPPEAPELHCIRGDGCFWVRRTRSACAGWDVIAREGIAAKLTSTLANYDVSSLTSPARTFLRVTAGIPSFPEELNEEHLFAESGIKRAVSYTKGCYVGQEVMSKVETLGKLPHRLYLLSLDTADAVVPDSPIFLGDAAIGRVATAVYDDVQKRSLFFAYLKQHPSLSIHSTPFVLGRKAKIEREVAL